MFVIEISERNQCLCPSGTAAPGLISVSGFFPPKGKKKRKIGASAKERVSKVCVWGVKTISPLIFIGNIHVKYQEVYQLTSCRQ